MKTIAKDLLNGSVFGVAQVVPGISGGTIAIIMGFYDRMLHTLNHFREDKRKHLRFLVPFALGIAVGILLVAQLIDFLLNYFSFPAMALFLGLIVGVIPSIFLKAKAAALSALLDEETRPRITPADVVCVLVPLAMLAVLAHVTRTPEVAGSAGAAFEEPTLVMPSLPTMGFLFVVSMVAAASLIVPGFSGSFVFLLAGVFHPIIHAVSEIFTWLRNPTDFRLMGALAAFLGPVAVGVIVGALLTARLMENMLTRHPRRVYCVALGLLVGSVYALLWEPILFQSGVTPLLIGMGVLTFALGVFVSYLLGKKNTGERL